MTGRIDVAVLGGGLTGLTLAAALGGGGAGVVLLERGRLEATLEPAFDGRVTAIALGGRRLLDAIGVWPKIAPVAQPILDIAVREGFSPVQVHYDHKVLGSEPMGWIVENRMIRAALLARLREIDTVTVLDRVEVAGIERHPGDISASLADGRVMAASLLAVAEGRGSRTRTALGIEARHWPYRQTGIVCTLRHERPHAGLAIERFFPDGPFARLPMTGDRSSIVWALRDDVARDVQALDDPAFTAEVAERFGQDLGRLELEGPRFGYPLSLAWAEAYTAPRAALVGDAARGIHPIAGQGWNLALRDVAALAEIVVDRLHLGLDPGDAAALAAYAAWRRFDGTALVTVTDGLNRLFANDVTPIRLLRDAGLALVERSGPVKRFFMRQAMGLGGDLPRSMRGQAL